jgi:hypothetical protein
MNLFNNDLMKLLDSLMPKEQYIIEKEGYAKGCGCEGNCGKGCTGGCMQACSDHCGHSCYGGNK